MKEEDFVRAVDDADFEFLIENKDRLYDFLKFVKESVDDGDHDVVIRCAAEDDDAGLPFYVWLIYKVSVDGDFVGLSFKQFYIPRDDNLESYYITPAPIEGRKFFTISVQ